VARITFQKRQKEMKRREKQQMKAERRAQRKLEKTVGGPEIAEMEQPIEGAPSEQEPELLQDANHE
jgi:hypothetical protein